MEYLELGSLDSVAKPMHEDQSRSIVRQILEGLEHMRAHGFIHRDLKPSVSWRPQIRRPKQGIDI